MGYLFYRLKNLCEHISISAPLGHILSEPRLDWRDGWLPRPLSPALLMRGTSGFCRIYGRGETVPEERQVCVAPVPLNVSLPAFAAERRRLLHGAPAPDRYLLPTERRAANPPATAAAVDRRDRQTDGWTVEIVCLIFTVLGILILEFYISRIGDQFSAELFSCCSTVDCLHVWPTLHYFAVRIWKWD